MNYDQCFEERVGHFFYFSHEPTIYFISYRFADTGKYAVDHLFSLLFKLFSVLVLRADFGF